MSERDRGETHHLQPDDSDPANALPLGQSVGKYLLMRRLGQGGMGVVYEAFDTLLHRAVALKVLANPVVAGPELERFLREARAAIQLSHPNVVTTYDVNRAGAVYFIALELVPGGSAQERLDRVGPFSWQEATLIVADACQGLAAAHAAGLIHRDVKPANLLLGDSGAKLADFGLVKMLARGSTSLTAQGHIAGTPLFMSPEQCRNEPMDERTDIYSLGATYYTLLAGKAPYDTGSVMQIMFAHCSRPIPDPRQVRADVPDACVAILQRAMAKEPGDRYPSASAMLADLEEVLGAEPPSERARPRAPQPSRRGLLVGAGVVALTGLGVAAWTLWPTTQPVEPTKPPVPWGRIRKILTAGKPGGVAFSPSGDRLYWTATEGVGVWTLTPDREEPELILPRIERIGRIAVSRDGKYLVVETARARVHIVSLETWPPRRLRDFLPDGGGVQDFAITPAGDQLLVAVNWWANAEPDRTVLLQTSLESGPEKLLNLGDLGHTSAVACLPGTERAFVGTLLGRILCYDYREHKVVESMHGALVPTKALTVSPDCAHLAVGGGPVEADTHGVELWDAKKVEITQRASRHTRCAIALAFSPDGRVLASGGYDHEIRLWDVPNKRPLPTLKGHTYVITGLAFSPDGQWLASVDLDNHFRLWSRSEYLGEPRP